MALIKGTSSSRLLKEAIVLDMGDLGRQADRMLATARTEAEKVIAQAETQAATLIAQADARGYDAGFARGERVGREEGHEAGRQESVAQFNQRLASLVEGWTAALAKWETDRAAMFHETRSDLIRFADAVARRVVHRMIRTDPTIIQDQLGHALSLLSNPSRLKISIHPDDRALAESVLPDLIATIRNGAQASMHDDVKLLRGSCVLTTEHGRIDASIAKQLDRIAEALVPAGPDENHDAAAIAPHDGGESPA